MHLIILLMQSGNDSSYVNTTFKQKMRLKSHESPRKQGRNNKSPKRSARTRQIKKSGKLFLRKLTGDSI